MKRLAGYPAGTGGFFIMVLLVMFSDHGFSQLSPGKLTQVHSHLEGLSNCTKCHSLGDKVTNDKCLACHKELNARILRRKGYHASAGISGKSCTSCHSDHHGLNFRIIRFEPEKFDHSLTGYVLTGAHAGKLCRDCHQPRFIAEKSIRDKKFTYLGLNTDCLACHDDVHQKTLPGKCTDCHGEDHFKPAVRFDHNKTAYSLTGKHTTVPCQSCHPVTLRNNKKFQVFRGLNYASCTGCHTDAHNNRFGQQCTDCHSTASFREIKNKENFDHTKTAFPLTGRHKGVPCTACHKRGVTVPVNHTFCTDCHTDYHENQFAKNGVAASCTDCHTTDGFSGSSFTIERHNESGVFTLKGAHLATPCFACHKKSEKWNFRNVGSVCSDCHSNVHSASMSPSYFSGPGCMNCHSESRWNQVVFDHSVTPFPLVGNHAGQPCRSCHYQKDNKGVVNQRFSGLPAQCVACHPDNHAGQFDNSGVTDCARCHSPVAWKIPGFNHDKTAFKLDGKHRELACSRCHPFAERAGNRYVLYKLNKSKCEDCH
jgi:hypothetical protein